MSTTTAPTPLAARLTGRLGQPLRLLGWTVLLLVGVEVVFGRGHHGHVLGLPFWTGVPLGTILNGAILGMLYALLAFGFILVYRANRLINFAQAGLGLVPAVTSLLLITNQGVPYFVALLAMLAGSAAAGAAVELYMRRFRTSPRLIAAVVTIGFGQLFVFISFFLPEWVGGVSLTPTEFPTPYENVKLKIGGFIFDGNYLAIVVATVVICAGLTAFLRFTRVGIAIRASAENADRAALLGVPVARLSTIVWVLAGLLSGVAIFLQAPVVALPTGGSVDPLVLLYGLAPAVIARMESLPVAFAAGIGIGVIQLSSFAGTSKPDLGNALLLPIVLVALLLQRGRLSRAFDTGTATFKALQEFRPVPAELRSLAVVVRTRWAVLGLAALGAVLAPVVLGSGRANFCSLVVIYAMVAVSLVVLSGWAGQISLGQFGFTGVGAAVAGGMAVHLHADFFVTLAGAALVGAVVAVLIGLPALRVQGLFLAVVTLAFAATVQYVVLDRSIFGWLLPGPNDIVGRPRLYGRISLASNTRYYYLCLFFLVLAFLSARSTRSSRSGRIFIGLRDNVRAAQSYGVNASRTRLAAFALSGAIASLAGALLAFQQQAVDQGSFGLEISIQVFLFVVVGGLTSLPGGVAGAVVFESLIFFGGVRAGVLATGVGVVFVLTFLPGGLGEAGIRLRDQLLRQLATRRRIYVPSLLADSRQLIESDDNSAADALTSAESRLSALNAPELAEVAP